ncbi:MAG: hypothetical protein ORN53_01940 [Crocinitomicaceae bacterium]|nr:hypothetical protein [Crocinitomicaceae bacterium]
MPTAWDSYTFRILYQTIPLEVSIDKNNVSVKNIGGQSISCSIMNEPVQIASGEEFIAKI